MKPKNPAAVALGRLGGLAKASGEHPHTGGKKPQPAACKSCGARCVSKAAAKRHCRKG